MNDRRPNRNQTAERLLRFSPEKSLGMLYVRPSDASPAAGWDALAEARWTVLVPAGMDVRLRADPSTTDADLTALDRLAGRCARTSSCSSLSRSPTPVRSTCRGSPGSGHSTCTEPESATKSVAAIGALRGLEWLSLTGTRVTDAGVKELAGLRQLRRFSAKETLLTDNALVTLAELPNLTWLSLAGTRVSDDGLRSLAQIPSLKMLSVARTDVTVDGATWWWTKRPDVELIAH